MCIDVNDCNISLFSSWVALLVACCANNEHLEFATGAVISAGPKQAGRRPSSQNMGSLLKIKSAATDSFLYVRHNYQHLWQQWRMKGYDPAVMKRLYFPADLSTPFIGLPEEDCGVCGIFLMDLQTACSKRTKRRWHWSFSKVTSIKEISRQVECKITGRCYEHFTLISRCVLD